MLEQNNRTREEGLRREGIGEEGKAGGNQRMEGIWRVES